MKSALKKIKHNEEIQDWDASDQHVPVPLAHRFFLKWKLLSVLPWRGSEEPAKIDVSPLTNTFSKSHLIGWTAHTATGPKPFLCPWAGQPVQQEMTDAHINNEQWPHASNHLPPTFPRGSDNLDPKWTISFSPRHRGSYTHSSGWQQFVDMGLGSRKFTSC